MNAEISAPPHADVLRDPAWKSRVSLLLLAVVLLWPMLSMTEFRPWDLMDAQSLQASWQFLKNFFPPAHDAEFLQLVLVATWQTIAMATAGVTLALLAAIPLALIVNAQLSISAIGKSGMARLPWLCRQSVRWLLVLLRSVPELVWALLFVRIVGLGPSAGVLAIALTYCGMLGKVYAEILESTDASCSRQLLENGSSRLQAFLYASLPAAASELASYTIYRWECAIRGSVIMGFVGAGGLGQRMDESMKMLAGAEVSTMLIVFMLLVSVADSFSQWLRRSLA
ncbi:PhnE/PtxC family ABC transporter permease [Undibacterium crateris]|uniref:PhnE/PtxC family ABC transporter permease n=1 Tax=Undibacterium crateris TaxID=2528175 RepID=UPI002E2B6FE5|nr:ABC transporter permease [Undibacterium crateris]